MQQVNLYKAEFKPNKDPLVLKNMLAGIVAFWLIGSAYAGWVYWGNQQSRQQLASLDARNQSLEQQVQAAEIKLTARNKDRGLELRNQRLRLQLRNTQSLSDAIAGGFEQDLARVQITAGTSFAEVLMALARHRIDPLWLQQIKILEGGARVVMSGATLQPEAVPRYLQALGNDNAFAGRIFNTFLLQPAADLQEAIRQFTIDTQAENAAEISSEGAAPDTDSSNPGNPVSQYSVPPSAGEPGFDSGQSVSLLAKPLTPSEVTDAETTRLCQLTLSAICLQGAA